MQRAWALICRTQPQPQSQAAPDAPAAAISPLDVEVAVHVESHRFHRGIYLRQPVEANIANTFKVRLWPAWKPLPADPGSPTTPTTPPVGLPAAQVTIEPVFHDDVTAMQRTAYEVRLSLRSSAPAWVSCPGHVALADGGKTIAVHVDPRLLPQAAHGQVRPPGPPSLRVPPGSPTPHAAPRAPRVQGAGVHVAFIRMYDERFPDAGPLCTVPITVIKPEAILPRCDIWHMETEALRTSADAAARRVLTLAPGERLRRFLVPPPGCQFVDVVIEDKRALAASAAASAAATAGVSAAPAAAVGDTRTHVIETAPDGPDDAAGGPDDGDDGAGAVSVYGAAPGAGGQLDVSARTVVLHALQVRVLARLDGPPCSCIQARQPLPGIFSRPLPRCDPSPTPLLPRCDPSPTALPRDGVPRQREARLRAPAPRLAPRRLVGRHCRRHHGTRPRTLLVHCRRPHVHADGAVPWRAAVARPGHAARRVPRERHDPRA